MSDVPKASPMEAMATAAIAPQRIIERLRSIERSDIFVSSAGDENSAGDQESGSDTEAGAPSPESRDDAALNGKILVSVDIQDDARAAEVRKAFAEFDAKDVSGS